MVYSIKKLTFLALTKLCGPFSIYRLYIYLKMLHLTYIVKIMVEDDVYRDKKNVIWIVQSMFTCVLPKHNFLKYYYEWLTHVTNVREYNYFHKFYYHKIKIRDIVLLTTSWTLDLLSELIFYQMNQSSLVLLTFHFPTLLV